MMTRKFFWIVQWTDGTQTRVDSARGPRDAARSAGALAHRFDVFEVQKHIVGGNMLIYKMWRFA